jgi:hypothetical protein
LDGFHIFGFHPGTSGFSDDGLTVGFQGRWIRFGFPDAWISVLQVRIKIRVLRFGFGFSGLGSDLLLVFQDEDLLVWLFRMRIRWTGFSRSGFDTGFGRWFFGIGHRGFADTKV